MPTMKGKTADEKLNWYRGMILSAAVEVDLALTWKLRTYFFPESDLRSGIFYANILSAQHFTFERKIALYQSIPYFKKLKNFNEVVESLRYVQKVRNAVAHGDLWIEGANDVTEVTILNPATLKTLKLNSRLVKEFIKHDKRLLVHFGWKFTLASKYGIGVKTQYDSKRNMQSRAIARLLSKFREIQ
jgi:hypothetical protein